MSNPTISAEEDCFDLLPDHLLLHIFHKLADAKSLIQCLSVSKRFASLVSQTDAVSLFIPLHKIPDHTSRSSLFRTLINSLVTKPLRFFRRIVSCNSAVITNHVLYYSPIEVLKQFKQVKSMHLVLPSYAGDEGLFRGDSLLKWKAEFDDGFQSCVILGATSFRRTDDEDKENLRSELEGDDPGRVLCDDELKLRVIWTISCLLAATARHYLLKQIVSEHPNVENVTMVDAYKQGKVCMSKDQIFKMRESMKCTAAKEGSETERTRVPDLTMEIWHKAAIELPETGHLVRGATLIVITPVGGEGIGMGSDWRGTDDLVGFDGGDSEKKACDEAVRELLRLKKSFVMTMNSF